MTQISNTTQLSTFDLIKNALLANSILSFKFSNSNIFQFEPKHKSSSFKGFPYIWINLPETEKPEKSVLDDNFTIKEFTIEMLLRMDYLARDRYLGYCNAIIKAIEDYDSTFQASGYHDVKIELLGTDPGQIIQQKEIVEGAFSIVLRGQIPR